MTASSPPRVSLFARAASVLGVVVATCGAVAAGIGGLDAALGATAPGRAMILYGAAFTALGLVLAATLRPRRAGEWRRLVIVAVGVWPFAAFALFIGWRIAVSGVQADECAAGNAEQCFTLAARRDRRGRVDEARALFLAGCDLGHAQSCATLGVRLAANDDPAANPLLERACDGGVAIACSRLADRTADPAAAEALRERACEAGDTSSCGGAP